MQQFTIGCLAIMQQFIIGCFAEEEPILIGHPLGMLLPNMAALRHQLCRGMLQQGRIQMPPF
jgi:hypothetical protein